MIRTVVLRVTALAVLLLLVLVSVIVIRTLRRLPDTLIYLVVAEETRSRLEAVPRRTRGGSFEAWVRAAISALADGPTEAEMQRGLSTAVPEGVRVWAAELEGGTLRLDLSADFELGSGRQGHDFAPLPAVLHPDATEFGRSCRARHRRSSHYPLQRRGCSGGQPLDSGRPPEQPVLVTKRNPYHRLLPRRAATVGS